MGINKEIHKSQPHSIILTKIINANPLDKAFEILLQRIQECPDSHGTEGEIAEIAERKLLGAELAAYVSYLIWMASRKTSKFLDGDGAYQALRHSEKRKRTFSKALQQMNTWLQSAVLGLVAVLGQAESVEGLDASAATEDAFEVPQAVAAASMTSRGAAT
jgi:hypothetical protein